MYYWSFLVENSRRAEILNFRKAPTEAEFGHIYSFFTGPFSSRKAAENNIRFCYSFPIEIVQIDRRKNYTGDRALSLILQKTSL